MQEANPQQDVVLPKSYEMYRLLKEICAGCRIICWRSV